MFWLCIIIAEAELLRCQRLLATRSRDAARRGNFESTGMVSDYSVSVTTRPGHDQQELKSIQGQSVMTRDGHRQRGRCRRWMASSDTVRWSTALIALIAAHGWSWFPVEGERYQRKPFGIAHDWRINSNDWPVRAALAPELCIYCSWWSGLLCPKRANC